MRLCYKKVIKALNSSEVEKIQFSIRGYAHYRNCCIESKRENIKYKSNEISFHAIKVKLTNDNTEDVSFYREFKEDCKIFRIRGRNYTLKQVWNDIEIIDIVTEKPLEEFYE